MKHLFTILFLTLSFSTSFAQDRSALLAPGTSAPDFKLTTLDNNSLSLKDFEGRYLVLDFWATWCRDCLKELPSVKALYEKYGDKVAFLGVSFDETPEALSKFLAEKDIAWAQGSEFKKWKETNISNAYGIKWIPSLYLIGKDGKVIATALTCQELIPELEKLF